MLQQEVVRGGQSVAPGERVPRNQAIERIAREAKLRSAGNDVTDSAVVDAEPTVSRQAFLPIALGDADLPCFDQKANLQKARRRNQERLAGSDQTFRAAVSPERARGSRCAEENHFLALKATPPRDDGSNVHYPRSTAASTHSRVMAALVAFFRGPATESR